MNDRQTITFDDFCGFVIMACFFTAIFVAPFITAAAYMDHERSWRAIPSPVSTGAVQVAGSHGVRRVLGPVVGRGLLKAAPGLAQQSHRPIRPQSSAGLDRDGSLRPDEAGTQGGVRPVPAALRGTDAAGSTLYEVTAYSHHCTRPRSGKERPPQRGADGRWPVADVTVAADTSLHPFGTELLIAGLGFRTVGDRGHAIKGRRLDLFMASCAEARAYGRRWVDVVPVPAQSVRYASLGGAQ